MTKPSLRNVFVLLAGSVIISISGYSQSGIYDRIGIIPEHGLHGAVPEENLDLFTGNLTLRFLDISLPGPNGFDLKIQRVYNSKVLKDRLPTSSWGFQQEPYSWVGFGWSMHMGRLHSYGLLPAVPPVIEFPDGRWETAWLSLDGTCYYTRDFLKYDPANYKLYFKDGTVWTFGDMRVINYGLYNEQVRVVTRIENSYGHQINITYKAGLPVLDNITDSLGREVSFHTTGTTNPKLDYISVRDASGAIQNYQYSVGTFSYGGYYQLVSFDPPEIPACTYQYNSGSEDHYELTGVTTSFGGSLEYTYSDHTFYFDITSLITRVVSQKGIRFSPGGTQYIWNYTYPSYNNPGLGSVAVDGPVFNLEATYHGYTPASRWKIGLLESKTLTDGSYSEQFAWSSRTLSYQHWITLSSDLGQAVAPLLESVTRTRAGDAEDQENFIYGGDPGQYGLPTRIDYYNNTGSLRGYKTLSYFFQFNSIFASKYMLSPVSDERIYDESGALVKQTEISYYSSPGACGANDAIERWKTGSTSLIWDYDYSSTSPNFQRISIDLPGAAAGTETYEYSYGILSKIIRPGYSQPELSRSISSYDSSILSETNAHGGTMSFSYDALGRILTVGMPGGFNDIHAAWHANDVVITQGDNQVVKYWDGLGRDTGYQEFGDGIILYFRKTLDAEGRIIKETRGSTNASDTYDYELSASGEIKKTTDPQGKMTQIALSGDTRTITDAENKIAVADYSGLPGLMSNFTDAAGRSCVYSYDAIGRLIQASYYSGSRVQTYSYDGLDNLLTETHPETGSIAYSYNSENNLLQKSWGGTQLQYAYNSANQIQTVTSVDETLTYAYDTRGRLSTVSSNSGWMRDAITYNIFGSVTGERQAIPGLGPKAIGYSYSANNVLSSITYPDGKSASYQNNGLNTPETINFNQKSLINQISYGYAKRPTGMNISGNGTEYGASYNGTGALSSATLNKGSAVLYSASYGYDGKGNILSTNYSAPGLNTTFGYDDLYRLTTASYSSGNVQNYAFTYDAFGNLNIASENSASVFSVSYNSANRVNGYTFDSRGNLTYAAPYSYAWDNKNRLISISNAGGSEGAFLYDERGLRLKAGRMVNGITVISPNGNETWVEGQQYEIKWSSNGVPGNVRIECTLDGGQTYSDVVASTENDASYLWTVPSTGSMECLMRIGDLTGSVSDTSDGAFAIVPPGQPSIGLDRGTLNFGAKRSGSSTSSQIFRISNNGGGRLIWTVASNKTWLTCSPTSGTDFGVISVSVNPAGLAVGTYTGILTVSDPQAINNPRQVQIKVRVARTTSPPYGYLDSPPDGQVCQGSIDVGGWALDDIEVQKVEIKRLPVSSDPPGAIGSDGLVYIGDAVFIEGARPDIEAAYPDAPFAYRGGWGYLLMTYGLPDQGMHDTFTLCAVAIDKEGNRTELGRKMIYCDNEHNTGPFGTIDTPESGGTAAGASFTNFGWCLTPQPDLIPYDGSTLWVWINGVSMGHPVYNNFRQDIADAYPGYANSDGAVGFYYIDTTQYDNGMHAIAWSATDSGGHESGFGSRYFWIQNAGLQALAAGTGEYSLHAQEESQVALSVSVVDDIPISWEEIEVSTGFSVNGKKIRYSPDTKGGFELAIKTLDRIEIHLSPDEKAGNVKGFGGYSRVLETLRLLPIGSTLDTGKGIFYWQPGPGFQGEYEFEFIKEGKDGQKNRKPLKIKVGDMPKAPKLIAGFGYELNEPEDSFKDGMKMSGPAAEMDNEGTQAEAGLSRAVATTGGKRPGVSIASGTLVYTYYLYSHDGKLLAEYDQGGSCVRDYIYAGNMLIEEYKPQVNQHYYYTPDQINSVRMVTNNSGDVVYSAAYSPFGKVHKEWVNAYSPELRYSGKEREATSGLDYFGARYYGSSQYRFLSVDPVINRDEAIMNPQLWNLYAYCRNNSITFMDPDGRDTINIFFGFSPAERGITNAGTKMDFPEFRALSSLAKGQGHQIYIRADSKEEFMKSLSSKDTWTIFVGHSFQPFQATYYSGIFLQDGPLTQFGSSSNKYVGIFACDSADYAFSKITNTSVLAVSSGRGTSAHSLANAAYSSLIKLILGKGPGSAASAGTAAIRESLNTNDRRDSVVW